MKKGKVKKQYRFCNKCQQKTNHTRRDGCMRCASTPMFEQPNFIQTDDDWGDCKTSNELTGGKNNAKNTQTIQARNQDN